MCSHAFRTGHRAPSSLGKLLSIMVIITIGLGLLLPTGCWAQDSGKKKPNDAQGDSSKADGKGAVVMKDGKPIENRFPGRAQAPSLEGGSAWLNCSGEISLKDLRGKIVIIDFWTYCCINCMHVLPDLKYLEKKYDKELVVIGCHSAKFDNEKDTEAIRRAIVRYEIEHPVVNDSEMVIWRKFQTRSWPTIAVIDPEGMLVGVAPGEGNRELLDEVVGSLVEFHSAKGTLKSGPIRFDLERSRVKSKGLKFPGKLLADEAGQRLFISDSNHNRIVVSSLNGKLIDVIGSGKIGHKDGKYADAAFDHPQGMVLKGDTLYVADTENHLIRTVDLKSKKVGTLAGTGQQARGRDSGGDLLKTALNSPWDLTIVGNTLFIAMAGPHQLWQHKFGSNSISVFSGTGREDITNGSHEVSAFAQPSGITSDGKFLYVADSEGSSIRKVAVDPDGKVTTVVGEHDLPRGATLFEFGDVDGVGNKARLQHPLGVLHSNGKLFVADSYNHKIKIVDLESRESKTWLGDKTIGDSLDPVRLHEPAGMTLVGTQLFIADTNNHRVVVVDTKATKPVGTVFDVEGLAAPASTGAAEEITVNEQKPVDVAPTKLTIGKTIKTKVSFQLPAEFKLNAEYPLKAKVTTEGTQNVIASESIGKSVAGKLDGEFAVFELPSTGAAGKGKLTIAVSYGYCKGGSNGVCKVATAKFAVALEAVEGGVKVLELKAPPAD